MPASATAARKPVQAPAKTTRIRPEAGRGELEAEGWPARLWNALARPGADSARVMYAHVLAPLYTGCAVFASAAFYTGMAAQAGLGPLAAAALAAAGGAVLAGVARKLLCADAAAGRFPHGADWARREPGHLKVVAAVAVAFTATTAAAAPATPEGWAATAAAGVLTLLACSARYWRYHRHHTRVVRPGAGASVPEPSTAGETPEQLCARVRRRWAQKVSVENGLLPGADLRIRPAPSGASGTVHLVAGKQDEQTVAAQLGKIASALGVSRKYLVFDDHEPEDESEPDPAVLAVEIMSAKVRSKAYPLNEYPLVNRRGDVLTLTVGGIVDGSGMAEYLLYDDSGIRHGYVTGATGAGKSVLVDTLVTGALESGVTSVLYIDPKGNSSPRIAEHAHVSVVSEDPKRWARVLDGVLEGMAIRKALVESGANNSSGFVPSPEFPGVLVVIDEIHRLTSDPDTLEKLITIAREGRSLGFGLALASQGYTAGDWGGSTLFRAQVTTANAFSLKLDKDQGNSYFQDFGLNPNKLLPDPNIIKHTPEGKAIKPFAGFAVSKVLGKVPLRTLFADEAARGERMAAARARAVAFVDEATYGAIDTGSGHLLSRAEDEREQMRAAAAAKVEAARRAGRAALSGQPLPPPGPQDAPAPAPGSGPGPGAGSGSPVAPVVDLAALRAGTWTPPEEDGPEAGTSPGGGAQRRSAAAGAVLELLAEGPWTRARLIEALKGRPGCGETAIKGALKSLSEEGLIERTRPSQKAPYRLL